MGRILTFAAYISFIIFLGRFVSHILSWIRAARQPSAGPSAGEISAGVIAKMILDIILFRRLFRTSRLLWIASWTFHISFFLILLRHMRYFMYPVPGLIISLQDTGVYAGYVLPLSLALILIIRMTEASDRFVSPYNYFLLVTILLTGFTGLLLKLFYRMDLVDVKAFALGIVTFSPAALPDSVLFAVHFVLVLILIPSLPFHLVAAPVITVEAGKREAGLGMVLHEK